MDEWKVESPKLEEVRQRLRRQEKEAAAKRQLEVWLEAWPWAKRVVEAEAPCAAPREEVWTRAEAKAREITDAIDAQEELVRPSWAIKMSEGPWERRWVGGNINPMASRAGVPHTVHDAFPSFPPNKKKKKDGG